MKRLARIVLLVGVLLLLVPAAALGLPTNVPASAFPPPESCGCHTALLSEWRESMHAKALDDKAYQTKLRQAQEATAGKLGAFCNSCHGPVATMTGDMATGNIGPATNGVNCMFCHQVTGTTKPPGNVSQVVAPDGTRRAQIKDPQAPHPTAYSAFHQTAAFCGACHNVRHPVNGMHLEATYKEWEEGPYAKKGVQCQDCHMSASPGAVGPQSGIACAGGPERPNIYRMTFVGANVGQTGADARRMLETAATLKLDTPEFLSPASRMATVTVTNARAGHYLPTGLTEVRQMWLEVTLEGAGGKEVVFTRKFGTELADKNGKHPVELWEAETIFSDDRIAPLASAVSTFPIEVAEGEEGGNLVATLYYRSLPEELASEAKVENPTTVMASAERGVYTSAEAAAKAANEATQRGDTSSTMLLVIAVAGIVAIAAILVYALLAGRRTKAS